MAKPYKAFRTSLSTWEVCPGASTSSRLWWKECLQQEDWGWFHRDQQGSLPFPGPWFLLWDECLGAHIFLRFPLIILALTHHFLSNVTTRPGLVLPQGPLVTALNRHCTLHLDQVNMTAPLENFSKLPGRVFRYKWVRHREPSSAPKEQHCDLRHFHRNHRIFQKEAVTLSLSLAGGFLLQAGLQARVEKN